MDCEKCKVHRYNDNLIAQQQRTDMPDQDKLMAAQGRNFVVVYIEFCPLHEAAEKMLITLNRFIIYHTQQAGQLTHILEAAEQITAKAEE